MALLIRIVIDLLDEAARRAKEELKKREAETGSSPFANEAELDAKQAEVRARLEAERDGK